MKRERKHKKTRSLLAVLLIGLLVCGCLAGCGSEGAEESASSQISASQDSSATAKKEAAKEKAKAAKEAKENKTAEEKKSEEKAGSEEENSAGSDNDSDASSGSDKSSSSSSSSSGKNSSSKKSGSSAKKESGSSSSGGSSGSSSQNTAAPAEPDTCSVAVTCHNLVGNDELKDNVRSRVPSSGVIMSRTTVEIESGDSVYDVLKRAAGMHGVSVSAETTALGIYVNGIGGFYEKDAGAQSGWKYKVNGTYPGDSAGDVKVHDGDNIEWVYALHP